MWTFFCATTILVKTTAQTRAAELYGSKDYVMVFSVLNIILINVGETSYITTREF
jgi:hypothetical protein